MVNERMVGKKKMWLKITVAEPPPAGSFGNIMADNSKKKPPADAPKPEATTPATAPSDRKDAGDLDIRPMR